MSRIFAMAAAALAVAFPSGARPASEQAGMEVSIQGQVGAGQGVQDLDTDTDVVYGAILGLHFLGPLALELDYHHAENDVSRLAGAATVKQNVVLAHVRLDFGRGPLTPFVYAGVGWGRYDVSGAIVDVEVDRTVVPVGAGLEFRARPLVIGVRGDYEWLTEDIVGENADFWKVVGTVGVRFP